MKRWIPQLLFGLAFGLAARIVLPGHYPGGWPGAALLSALGAAVGALAGGALPEEMGRPGGFVLAGMGSIAALLLRAVATG